MTGECVICLDEDSKSIKLTFPCKCPIFFHKSCFEEWYKVNVNHLICPICRIPFRQTDNISFDTVVPFNQYIANNPIYRLTHPPNSDSRESTIMPHYLYIWNYSYQNMTIIQKLLFIIYKIIVCILIFSCVLLPLAIFYIAVRYNW